VCIILGTGGTGSERDCGRGACIELDIPRSFTPLPLELAWVLVVCVWRVDVESAFMATNGRGGGDSVLLSRSLSTVDPEPEKKRGESQEAGAVADLLFSFSFALASSVCLCEEGLGLVARLYALPGRL